MTKKSTGILMVVGLSFLAGCAHAPLAQEQIKTRESIRRDADLQNVFYEPLSEQSRQFKYYNELNTKLMKLEAKKIKSILSSCSLENKFEIYELASIPPGISALGTISALYCREENNVWLEHSWSGCFGGGKETYGPFALTDNKLINKQSILRQALNVTTIEKVGEINQEDRQIIDDAKEIMLKDGLHPEDYEYSIDHLNDLAIVSYELIHEPNQVFYGGVGQITFRREGTKYTLVDKVYGQ